MSFLMIFYILSCKTRDQHDTCRCLVSLVGHYKLTGLSPGSRPLSVSYGVIVTTYDSMCVSEIINNNINNNMKN
jgi:hypothetical protein